MIIKTGIFTTEECVCTCGNKHENYGGLGYEEIPSRCSITYYSHIVKCKKCGAISKFIDSDD